MRIAGQRHGVKDWTGTIVGWLTVVSYVDVNNKNSRWRCRCVCGTETVISACDLRDERAKSCGCKKAALIAASRRTHGGAPRGRHDPAYNCWVRMRDRCYNPKNNRFHLYGGRGIAVCDRWRFGADGVSAFACFLQDMGPRPGKDHSIDRVNCDGNYEPSNCRWANYFTQACNRRAIQRSAA